MGPVTKQQIVDFLQLIDGVVDEGALEAYMANFLGTQGVEFHKLKQMAEHNQMVATAKANAKGIITAMDEQTKAGAPGIMGLNDAQLAELAATIEQVMEKRQKAAGVRDQAEKEVQECTTHIKAAMVAMGVNRFEGVGHVATFTPTERKTLSPQKLALKGVPVDVINECYDVSKSETLRVTPRTK